MLGYSEHGFRHNWGKMICSRDAIKRISAGPYRNKNAITDAIKVNLGLVNIKKRMCSRSTRELGIVARHVGIEGIHLSTNKTHYV